MDRRIVLAIAIVTKNYAHHTPLNQIAAEMSLSPSHFQHLFKQETGQTYSSYRRELRIIKAQDFLTDWRASIKQVAYNVGYSYVPNFVRDFKRRFGKTPSQYRKEIP